MIFLIIIDMFVAAITIFLRILNNISLNLDNISDNEQYLELKKNHNISSRLAGQYF